MIDIQEVRRTLTRFAVRDDGEARKSKDLTLALLANAPDPFARAQFHPGHITGTAVVLSPKRKRILLVHHARLERWLLPGGHTELEDTSVAHTARREAMEETGACLHEGIPPRLVGVDVHAIPANQKEPLHLHHDLIFAFQARSKEFRGNSEVRSVVWCDLTHFDRYDLPGSIRRSVLRAISYL